VKLYFVSIQFYAVADDEIDIRSSMPIGFDVMAADVDFYEVDSADKLSSEWDNCYPFSYIDGISDKSCGELLIEAV